MARCLKQRRCGIASTTIIALFISNDLNGSHSLESFGDSHQPIQRILSVGHLSGVELIALSTSTQGCADGGMCYAAQENSTVDAHAASSDLTVFVRSFFLAGH